MKQLTLLFGMRDRVGPRDYLFWGVLLMVVKYAGEVLFYYLAKGDVLEPIQFLSPLITSRYPGFTSLPDWFVPAVVLWSLPFIWIGMGMSIRRAADAGLSPWLGVAFFVPGLNYLLMALLSFLPSSPKATWVQQSERFNRLHDNVISPFLLTAAFALGGTFIVWLSASVLKAYDNSLFLGSPLILGLVQGYILNYKKPQTFGKTAGFVALSVLLVHLFLLVFALEGAICLAMSLPISTVLAIFGAVFGAGISRYGRSNRVAPAALVLILPIMPWLEQPTLVPHQDSVLSRIEISAPPEKVWPNVVKFSDLPPTQDWLFKLGVAYPVRARISGEGVGAVRRCEFSTGAFVEPITTWDEPHHLAFSVKFQPEPMKELSFYDHVDAPHLHGYFRSVRGEFRLIPTADGKTILEGRTWYEMDIHPGWYWQLYGRWFIHKIHMRVLAHIKEITEV